MCVFIYEIVVVDVFCEMMCVDDVEWDVVIV